MLTALLAGAFVVVAQAGPEPTPAPTGGSGGGGPGIDIGALANGIVNGILDGLGGTLTTWTNSLPLMAGDNAAKVGKKLLDGIWSSPYNFMTRIPPELSTHQPEVVSLGQQFRGVQVGLMVLLCVVAGYRLMFGHAKMTETAIQFGLSMGAAASLAWWSDQALGIANGVSDNIGWPSGFDFPVNTVLGDLALIALFLIVLFLAVKAFFKGAATLLLIDILLVVGPLVLLLWMIPQTSKWAAWWVDQFVAAVVSRPATAIIFRIGFGIVATVGDPFLALILGGAAFWLATELPDRLASNLSVTGGIASLARIAVLQRAAGAAGGAASGVASAAGVALSGQPSTGVP